MNSSNRFGFTPLNAPKEQPESLSVEREDTGGNRFGFTPIKKQETEPEESYFESGVRKISGNLVRGFESILGIPGEFQELAEYITKPLAEMIIPVSENKKELAKTRLIPTSSELRKKTKELTGEYLEPRGKGEESAQEISSLVGSLVGPMSFRKALGIAVGSQSAKEGLKLFGASPTTQEAGKFGTMLGLSMINPNGIKKFWSGLYEKREALTPVGTIVDGTKLEKAASDVISQIKKGTIAPSEAKVLDQAEKVLAKIQNGKVDLNEMVATKRSLNEIAGDPELFKRGQHLFPKLQKAVDSTLALHPNKEAVKLGKMADEAFSAFHESQKLSKYIKKIVGDKPLKSVALSAGIEALSGHPEAIIPTLVGAATISSGVKSYELVNRIFANPTTRKYYLDLLINASKQNSVSTKRTLEKLDNELLKKEKSPVSK